MREDTVERGAPGEVMPSMARGLNVGGGMNPSSPGSLAGPTGSLSHLLLLLSLLLIMHSEQNRTKAALESGIW